MNLGVSSPIAVPRISTIPESTAGEFGTLTAITGEWLTLSLFGTYSPPPHANPGIKKTPSR